MSSIRIRLNGEHQQTVSLEQRPGVLSCILNYMGRRSEDSCEDEDEYQLCSGGIDNEAGDYVNWPVIDLKVGDNVELEIVEESEASPLAERRPHDGREAEYSKKDYIRRMAKEFGWRVIEDEVMAENKNSEQSVPAKSDRAGG